MMEDAELPGYIPHLKISKEISLPAARDYLQARDEEIITSLPPFRSEGNTTTFLYYNPEKAGVYIYKTHATLPQIST